MFENWWIVLCNVGTGGGFSPPYTCFFGKIFNLYTIAIALPVLRSDSIHVCNEGYTTESTTFESIGVRSVTCMIWERDHEMQLAAVKTEPFRHFSWIVVFLWMCIGGCQLFVMIHPLYNVMIRTPAKETKVPITFAIAQGFCISRTSGLYSVAVSTIPENFTGDWASGFPTSVQLQSQMWRRLLYWPLM